MQLPILRCWLGLVVLLLVSSYFVAQRWLRESRIQRRFESVKMKNHLGWNENCTRCYRIHFRLDLIDCLYVVRKHLRMWKVELQMRSVKKSGRGCHHRQLLKKSWKYTKRMRLCNGKQYDQPVRRDKDRGMKNGTTPTLDLQHWHFHANLQKCSVFDRSCEVVKNNDLIYQT